MSAELKARSLVTDAMLSDLRAAIQAGWTRAVAKALAAVADQMGLDPEELARSEQVRGLLAGLADRITGIEEETRARVAGYAQRALDNDLTPGELAKLIRDDPSGAFSPSRARLIARTETATAINKTSLAGYAASGRVEHVEILDGEGCSWPEGHGEEPYADGMVVTIEEADAAPIAHPGCVRAVRPVVDLD